MKIKCAPLVVLFSAFLSFGIVARAQNYSVDWYKISGGGGTSTGSVFSVSGTIGQPDAGAMSGGAYSLQGGFWSIYAVQLEGAPLLRISITATNTAIIAWPSPSTGWNLQVCTNLTNATWTAPSETMQNNGTERFIVVNPPSGNRFYRLIKP